MLLDSPALRPAPAPSTDGRVMACGRPSARKKADPEAVERRRYARRAASGRAAPPPPDRAAEDLARRTRQTRVCAEMVRRYVPAGRRGEPLLVDYRYWQLRRCGWDVLRGEWRQTEGPRSAWSDPDRPEISSYADPADCPVWRWWCGLHHESRKQLVDASRLAGMSVAEAGADGEGGRPRAAMVLSLGGAAEPAEIHCAETRI